MKTRFVAIICAAVWLTSVAGSPPTQAQEILNSIWGWPMGLTEDQTLRLQIVPLPPREHQPPGVCNVRISAKLLRAKDLVLLEAIGPIDAGVANSFAWDFSVQPGPPPSREEVIVKLIVERVPTRLVERSALRVLCPLSGSLQIFDEFGEGIVAWPFPEGNIGT